MTRTTALFILLLLSGCSSAPVVPEVMPADPPVALEKMPAARLGARIEYELALVHTANDFVPGKLTIEVTPDLKVLANYQYAARPEFNSRLNGTLRSDGAWQAVDFDCEPVFPYASNGPCNANRGGYGKNLGLDGPFFASLMLAGLDVSLGVVRRSVEIGTQSWQVEFQVYNVTEGELVIEPVRKQVRILREEFGHQSPLDPLACSIFTGRITVSRLDGLPTSCHNLDGVRIWQRTGEVRFDDARAFVVHPVEQGTAGLARVPPLERGAMPFGLDEALEEASRADARIADALASERTWLGSSTFLLSGATEAGLCPACVTTYSWTWQLRLHAQDGTYEFSVTKDVTMPLGTVNYTITDVETSPPLSPSRFPRTVAGPADIWNNARELLGFSPLGLIFQMPRFGSTAFVNLTDSVEPYWAAVFLPSEGGGPYFPTVWYAADGELELFMANGARPDPFVNKYEAGPPVGPPPALADCGQPSATTTCRP